MKANRNEIAMRQYINCLQYVCVNLINGLCIEGAVMRVGTHDFTLCCNGNTIHIRYKDIIGINGF